MNSNSKTALVLGGSSFIGKNIIKQFKSVSPYWNVMNIDFAENKEATKNYIIPQDFTKICFTDLRKNIDCNFDFIINSNGYPSKLGIQSEEGLLNFKHLNNVNLSSSILACYLAKKHLNPDSLLVLIGSFDTKNSNSSQNLLFNMAKNSVHHLTEILIKNPQELPDNTKLITLLPYIIILQK